MRFFTHNAEEMIAHLEEQLQVAEARAHLLQERQLLPLLQDDMYDVLTRPMNAESVSQVDQSNSSTTLPGLNELNFDVFLSGNPFSGDGSSLNDTQHLEWLVGVQDGEVDEQFAPSESKRPLSAIDNFKSVIGRLRRRDDAGNSEFVGPTSNLHLRTRVLRDLRSVSTSLNDTPANRSRPLSAGEEAAVDLFWQIAYAYCPVFGATVIPQRVRIQTVMLQSMMLALGLLLIKTKDQPVGAPRLREQSEIYKRRFSVLLEHELDHISLENVQAFLLRAQLAIINGNLESATIFSAIACAMAKRMGLHADVSVPTTMDDDSNASDQHRRARDAAFYACFWMDRYISPHLPS
ncbi:hypothetical protein G7054_g3346 [Neopestalotiopsis clavispora]|nr:hypothetical protein G7054_g3346 [Neopestalotiopsis clavispora]